MDKLLEALAILLGWPKREEVTKLLHEKAQPIAQHFIDMGHGIEREASKETIRLANEAKAKAEGDLVAANQTIESLKKDKPDVAAMQNQHNAAMEDLKKNHRKEKDELSNTLREVLVDRDLGIVRKELVEKHKVDPEVATVLTLQSPELRNRIKHTDHKSPPQVFQAGTQTPITVASGQEWFQPVVEEVKAKVPKGAFTYEGDDGTEASGHGTQSGGGGGKSKDKQNLFDTIRSNTKAQVEKQQAESLAEKRQKKLGGPAPAR